MRARQDKSQRLAACFKESMKGSRVKKAKQNRLLLKVGKGQETDYPLEPPAGKQPC